MVRTLDLRNANYGGMLQAFALVSALARRGVDGVVDISNTQSPPPTLRQRAKEKLRRLAVQLELATVVKPVWIARTYRSQINHRLYQFIDEHIPVCTLYVPGSGYDSSTTDGFDLFVAGSDQIWRRDYGDVESYLFDFLDSTDERPRITYAGSFGSDAPDGYDAEFIARTRELARRFTAVSVREESGKDLASMYWGLEAERVPDPTMLLPADVYLDLADSGAGGGLVSYLLDANPEVDATLTRLRSAFARGVDLNRPAPRSHRELRRKPTYFVRPGIDVWLGEISRSDGFITDSFHGCVFAIIFHRNFLVSLNQHRGTARFSTLLSVFGLEDRILRLDTDPLEQMQAPIDWAQVDAVLQVERDRGNQFLDAAISVASERRELRRAARQEVNRHRGLPAQSDITVVIPTHERPLELRRAIESVFSQVVSAAEIIIVDDTLDSSARSVASEYSAREIPVRYVTYPPIVGQPGAPGRSRNFGANLGRSSIIAFLDDDDEWEPDYLASVAERFNASGLNAVAVTGSQFRTESRVERNILSDFDTMVPGGNYFWGKGVTGSNLAVSKSLFQHHHGFDEKLAYAEDWELFARVVAGGATVMFTSTVLVTQHVGGHGHLSSKSSRTENALRDYLARHHSRLSTSERRDIHRLIHVQGRRPENRKLARTYHLAQQFRLSTWRQRVSMVYSIQRHDRLYE